MKLIRIQGYLSSKLLAGCLLRRVSIGIEVEKITCFLGFKAGTNQEFKQLFAVAGRQQSIKTFHLGRACLMSHLENEIGKQKIDYLESFASIKLKSHYATLEAFTL